MTKAECEAAVARCGSKRGAAREAGVSESTFRCWMRSDPRRVTATHASPIQKPSEAMATDLELRRLRGQLKSATEKYQHALTEIDEWQKRVEVVEPLGATAPSGWQRKPVRCKNGTTAVVVMTDWHCEETVTAESVNGLNEYNLDVASRRIKRAFAKSLDLIESWRRSWKVDEIYLAILGDMITGYIHEELEESNGLSPTEAILFAEQHIVDGIEFILREGGVRKLIVPTCHGNHGRTTKKKRIKTGHQNSFEWLLYRSLERQYRRGRQNVEFRVANGIHNLQDVRGHLVRFHHGDSLKYNGGVGGITIPVNKAIAQWNISTRAAFDVFGHWHQFLHTSRFVACNCLIGYSDFALEIKAEYQPPSQTVIFVDRDYGKVAALEAFVE